MPRSERPLHQIDGPGVITRRHMLGLLGAGAGAVSLATIPSRAQESTPDSTPAIVSNQPGEMPSSGGLRPGPVGQQPPTTTYVTTIPVTISADSAGISADVEALDIQNGRLADPTGPWVVSWYRQSAQLGEPGNVLMAGHVDYWGVGPSVF
ncbi:MAG TPA: class F sortase, partial [Thermomicrobiales bacterium]|nr:class F sortase [Thermomicrobiales bacterium]